MPDFKNIWRYLDEWDSGDKYVMPSYAHSETDIINIRDRPNVVSAELPNIGLK